MILLHLLSILGYCFINPLIRKKACYLAIEKKLECMNKGAFKPPFKLHSLEEGI